MSSPSQSGASSIGTTSKKRTQVKPEGFQDVESLVKNIFEGKGQSYYEWLHQKHQEVVLEFNLSHKERIASLAKGAD
ncbi:MAG: hypothetical protein RR595_09460 [Lysinibacillus sp.]